MSLYQQSQGYGQGVYPVHGYLQQGPPMHMPPAPYPYHQPQPVYFTDPSSFRRDYASRLSELTINSRPIIQNLSMIAQDYTRFADIVAQCLEAHIRRVAPWMKLPAFYLLDAISKNVFEPYAAKFSSFVIPLFLETYAQVDPNTRSKMEEMLVTWRNGTPNGKELFGIAAQVTIERSIWGNDSSSLSDNPSRRYAQGSGPITKSQVLAELEVTLAQKDRQVNLNPYDLTSKNHVAVLHQLRKLVETGVSQEELSQILVQLRALARETASAPPPPPPAPAPAPLVYNSPQAGISQTSFAPASIHQTSYLQPSVPTSQATYPSQSSLQPYPSYGQPQLNQVDSSSFSVPSTSTAATSLSESVAPTSSISDLFNTLLKAGLVSTAATVGGPADEPAQIDDIKQPEPVNEASNEYAKAVLAMKINLTTSEITKQRPHNISFLYEQLPIQCKQCAIRFPEGSLGQKRMEDHLDMHFRQNRRANQNVGRGHSRSWYIGVESWTNDISDDDKGKGRADGLKVMGKAAAASEAAEREAALRASYVVVPPGHEAQSISCPVCKEILKSEFNEDDEEWVWRDAVRIKDKIYHATCHAEMASSHGLVARLRNEAAAYRSRSGTPEIADLSRSTPISKHTGLTTAPSKLIMRASKSPTPEVTLAGTKRKAEDDVHDSATETGERTPPTKKVACS